MNQIKDKNSTVISDVSYNSTTSVLSVVLHGGATYLYESVPHEVFKAFVTADSLGSFFSKHIRTNKTYQFSRLGDK